MPPDPSGTPRGPDTRIPGSPEAPTDGKGPAFLSNLADGAGPLDVGADLRQQVVETGELAGGADLLEDVELDRPPVEIAVEVEHVGLDLADLLAEGDVGSNVAGGGQGRFFAVEQGVRGVDAVGGDQRVDPFKVGGREAESRPRALRRG